MRVVEDDSGSMLSLGVVNLHQATVVPYQITRLGQPIPKANTYYQQEEAFSLEVREATQRLPTTVTNQDQSPMSTDP